MIFIENDPSGDPQPVGDEGLEDDVMKITVNHSICKTSLCIKHYSLLADLFNMSGGTITGVRRLQLQGER